MTHMNARMPAQLDSERLILRLWRDEDIEPFGARNAAPKVMEHFPTTLSRVETEQSVERIRAQFQKHGFGLWAVELRETGHFAGCVGLHVPDFDAPFTPWGEVGGLRDKPFWGKGYAPEAAVEAMRDGYDR